MVHVNNKQQVVVAVSDSGGVRGGDHAPPAAHLLAELGADPKIIASALRKRPDLMPEQVRATWQYCQQRIAESNGKLNSGIFFHAMKQGQIHAAPPDPDRPIPVEDYAQQPGYTRGSDTAPQTDAEKQATAYADAHWRAVDLLGKGAPFREMAIIVEALVAGDSDAAALAALEAHRKRVAR